MARSNVKINGKVIAELLKDPKVEADLLGRAEKIAAAAGPGFKASSMVGKNRARASVVAATHGARRREAKDGALSKALGAGR